MQACCSGMVVPIMLPDVACAVYIQGPCMHQLCRCTYTYMEGINGLNAHGCDIQLQYSSMHRLHNHKLNAAVSADLYYIVKSYIYVIIIDSLHIIYV